MANRRAKQAVKQFKSKMSAKHAKVTGKDLNSAVKNLEQDPEVQEQLRLGREFLHEYRKTFRALAK